MLRKITVRTVVSIAVIVVANGCSPQLKYTRPSSRVGSSSQGSENNQSAVSSRSAAIRTEALRKIVDSYVGVPYRYGGTTRRGMDCSGFVWRVYRDLGFSDFKRMSSAKTRRFGTAVSLATARPGDLLFFRSGRQINHVAIFMGSATLAHASREKGVCYASCKNKYIMKYFVDIRRMY